METIAVYGKGGIGKSVVATSLSALFAREGKKVLHVGCDPKGDSARRLLGPDKRIGTVLSRILDAPGVEGGPFIEEGRGGVSVCETGGPDPGVGCAGHGVARALDHFEESDLLRQNGYDVVVFDVLGDVVCGGFAAPLRAGFARKVLIVTSSEPMSLYAANNISRAVRTYASNGVSLLGLVGNLRTDDGDPLVLEIFARLIRTRVLGVLQRDPAVIDAERACTTVVEHAPDGDSAAVLQSVATAALQDSRGDLPLPFDDDEMFRYLTLSSDAIA